jgi:biotin carboxyl carrier protein
MKYEVEIRGQMVSVELEERNGRVEARVGQREYDLEMVSPEAGVFTFLAGDHVYEARVWIREAGSLSVTIDGQSFPTRVIDRKHRRSNVEQGIQGRQNLVAPMPGKVVRVLLAAGDQVALGQGVVVVEAMKMQNEIKSPKAGRVLEVRVTEGMTVEVNQILAIVE